MKKCVECQKQGSWAKAHPQEKRIAANKWARNNDSHRSRVISPWSHAYNSAYCRCNLKSNGAFNRYGAKGIRLLMTNKDFKFLWFRDKAYLMKRPSIDRIDPKGNYEMSNCRYLELSENIRRK